MYHENGPESCAVDVFTIGLSSSRVNNLPSELRNMTNCSSESSKQHFSKTIPGEPHTSGYTYMRRVESNSLIHMTPFATARHPSISEEIDNMPQARGGNRATFTAGFFRLACLGLTRCISWFTVGQSPRNEVCCHRDVDKMAGGMSDSSDS